MNAVNHRLMRYHACRWLCAAALAGMWLGLFSALAGCGGDASAPREEEQVSEVVISGAPALFLVGDSARLVATAMNASGGVVSSQTVTWSSSAPGVATVRSNGTLLALRAGTSVITAAAGGQSGTAAIAVSDGGIMGPQGGTLVVAGSAVKLIVPAGALAQASAILVQPAPGAPADARVVPGTVWDLGPVGLVFGRAATLTLAFDSAKLSLVMPPQGFQLYVQSENSWIVVAGSRVDPAAQTVTGNVSRAGIYAVRSTPVDRISLRGPAAVYAGRTARVAAALFSSSGDSLVARPLDWSSSDVAVATVDGDGKLSAVTPGSAAITASCDGRSATLTVTVLVLPTGNSTGDWTTYQGNPRHTGFVDVQLNPAAFRLAWKKPVQPGVALQPVATGDGKVFVSTQVYYGTQVLAAVDASTGSVVWSKDFGRIHWVDPPAYADGSVYVQTSGHEDAFLWAFDGATGLPRFRTQYLSQWQRYFAPVVFGEGVYMAGGYDSGMYAIGSSDGNRWWLTPLNNYELWTPAVKDGKVFAYTGEFSPKVSVVDAASGALVYEIADPKFIWQGWSMDIAPVLGDADDLLATQGFRLLSFDLTHHSIRFELNDSFKGTPSVANGVIYVFNGLGLEARREADGGLLWRWQPPAGQPTNTSIVTRNLLFVTTGSITYALDLATHVPVWSYPAGGPLALSKQGQLLISGSDGTLTAIAVQ